MLSPSLQLKLLAAAAVILILLIMVIAIHFQSYRSMLLSTSVVLFYVALYLCDRRAGLHRHVRRGLGYAAVVLGAFISSFFFFYSLSPAAGMPPTLFAAGVGLCFVVAAYYLHRLTVLHRDYYEEVVEEDEQAGAQRAQDQVQVLSC